MYWVGYIITFLLLYSCERRSPEINFLYSRFGIEGRYLKYLDDMGFIKPFSCARGKPFSAAIQALWWPWPFILLALAIALLPFFLIFAFFKDK